MKGSTPTLLASLLLLLVAVQPGQSQYSPVCNQGGKYLVRNPQDCRSYFYCFEGQSFYGLCATGHRFDEVRQSCLQAAASECFNCPATGVSHLPDPAGCNRYVLCFHGVPHERICPEGLLYNQQLRQCDLLANVDCRGHN